MAIVKKISIDDPQGAPEIKDIGADAVNVDYDEEHSVKDKIDELSENVSTLSSTVEGKLDAEGGSLAATVAGSVTTQISSSDVSSVDTAALIWGKFNALRKEFGDHVNSPLYTENGIHGIRYYGGVLQVWDSINETWIDVGGGAEYPEGGSTGQALIKASAADNDVTWGNISLASNVSGILSIDNGGTGATTTSDARTNLGLGSLATKSSVSLTTDITETLPLANGGTGATTAENARTNLELGSLATKSTVSLTSDVSGILPISKGGTGNSAGYIRTGQKSGTTIGARATAEGEGTTASSYASHAEGYNTTASGTYSHAEGNNTTAYGYASHAEGCSNVVSTESVGIYAFSNGAHAEGYTGNAKSFIRATGKGAHAEGYANTSELGVLASGDGSHAEGDSTTASGAYSHAEGMSTVASAPAAHAEGVNTAAAQSAAHAEGYSLVKGNSTVGIYASNDGAHAEGCSYRATSFIRATGLGAHAEGYANDANTGILASGIGAHAEGYNTTASGDYSHAEGNHTTASGSGSHAEGDFTTASGVYSHAEGANVTASGGYSHAEGYNTYASGYNHAQGHRNKTMTAGNYTGTTGDAMAIGNGTSSTQSNAFRVTFAGQVYGLSAFNSSGADYAEFFEWEDGNEKNEDRVGLFVTLDEDKIKLANTGDYILGVISGQPSVIGNGDEDWLGRWQRDDFGRFIWGEIEEEDSTTKEKQKIRTILPNPDYDPEQKYIERKDRPEWDCVGMLGALAVRDNGKCEVNGFCRCGNGGIAVPAENGYRVIKRVSDNVVKIIFSL